MRWRCYKWVVRTVTYKITYEPKDPRMTSRRLIVWLALFSACLLGCWAQPANAADRPDDRLANARPNIILVMTDDQGYGDVAAHGHPYLKTPNLDSLRDQSVRLTDFHCSPTCSPTRAALLTGNAPFKNGITHTILERERMALSSDTLAQALKQAGYATGIFGKWHLGDEAAYQPDNRGFDEVFIHGAGGIGQKYPGSCADVPGNGYFDPVIRHNDTFVKTQGFCTDVFFRQSLGWIRQKQQANEPFFAMITTNAPHGPFICPDKYKPYLRQHTDNARRVGFYGMIHNIDDNMGRLMAKLDQWGLAENTLLIFMSDNGSAMGDFPAGMRGRKGSPHEGGSRVPAFWRWPGQLEAGRDIDTMLRHYDIAPTLAAIAGARMPGETDGRSMLPLLAGEGADWPERYTVFHCGRWDKAGAPGGWGDGNTDPDKAKYTNFAVRSEHWRLVNKDQLYDLRKDPGETTNVIDQHPEVAAKMLAHFDAWWDEVRPMLVNEDAALADHHPVIRRYEKQKEKEGIPAWQPPAY